MDGYGLTLVGVPICIEASGNSNPQFIGSWVSVLAVKLDSELEPTLWMIEGGIAELPCNLDEFPRTHAARPIPHKSINGVEVDEAIGGGLESTLIPALPNLRAHSLENILRLRDECGICSPHAELPVGGAGKISVRIDASKDVQSWG